jgi:CzcA family heavy metal efflux pump
VKWLEAILARTTLVWAGWLFVCVAGFGAALRMPSGIYPEVEFPRIVVVARSGDAPPGVTQVVLTRPLEAALATVLGVERIRSRTIRGAAELSLQFAPCTDMWRASQLVESRMAEARADLPLRTELSAERLTTTSFPIVTFNVSGVGDARQLREAAEFIIKPAISRVRGVGRVEVLGGDVREVEIILDPERVAALRLSPSSVADKVTAQTSLQAVGRLERDHAAVTVMASAEPSSLDEVRALVVGLGANGAPIALSSIAEVTEGAEDRLLRVSGPEGDIVLVSVARLTGASTPEVVRAVEAALADIESALPRGVKVTAVYDQSQLVSESINSVRDAIGLGAVLCVVVIASLLRNVRAGLVAALTLPLTLGATLLAASALGQSLNLMSMGGLAVAIGLIIDDAIVVVEGIGQAMSRGLTALEAAREATAHLGRALVGTTATTIVVFLPLLGLDGVVGRFFTALALTLTAAVLISLVAAVTIVPVAAKQWLTTSVMQKPRLAERYVQLLEAALRKPWFSLGATLVLIAVGVVSALEVPTGFLPTMDEGAFVIDYFLPASTSLHDTSAVANRLEHILATTPEVATWSRRTGAELGPRTATLISRGDVMVRLTPRSGRTHTSEEIIEAVRKRVALEVPEARVEFVQVLQDVLNDLSGAPRPIEVKIFGNDVASLKEAARDVVARLRDVPGLVDLYEGFEGESPELRFRIDPAAAARAGRSAESLTLELDAALHGVVAGSLRRPDRPIAMRVRYPDSTRFDPDAIARLPIALPSGELLPLSSLAPPRTVSSETQLIRESLRPVVLITADHEERDLGSVASDLRARLKGLALPRGMQVELGGQSQNQKETLTQLGTVMLLGAVAVALVLLAQFRRAVLVLIVLAAVPLPLGGALTGLWLTQTPLNAASLMGCVLLIGLVVKNGILLLEHFETRLTDGQSAHAALLDAGRARVRPIVMTTLATVAGLAPLALGLGSGAELQRPLAIAVIGGLFVSLAVSLVLVPTLVHLTVNK